MEPSKHTSVLLHTAVDSLTTGWSEVGRGKVFVDGTIGGGGHSLYLHERFPEARIVGLDRDPAAIQRIEELRLFDSHITLVNDSFRHLDTVLAELEIKKVDAILLDLGLSSDQLEPAVSGSGRGFSFRADEPLDMRMGGDGLTAADVLNGWEEETIALILRAFGEERYARRIAASIVAMRQAKPFQTTFDLLEAVRAATPASYERGRIHPATRTFQAMRIAVNDELPALEEGLRRGFALLAPGGRLGVISFHSLEDRIVKHFMRDRTREGAASLVTKKPIVPEEAEVRSNPRSRSAKFRVVEHL